MFTAEVINDSWLGIGFGENMRDTDMIVWLVEDGVGEVRDVHSMGYGVPGTDELQNVTQDVEPKFDSETNKVTFVTRRKLDTEDPLDKVLELDEQI